MKVKTSKGITLIALIITIIVLLILAGVTIATLTGENGLLNKATTAREETEKAEMDEKIKLAVLAAIGTDGKVNLAEVKEELDNQGVEGTIEDGTLKVTTDNKEYTISENGTIGEEEISTPSEPTEKTVLEYARGAMPAGADIKSGTTEDTGIVMIDDNGNEWVWIEVPSTVFTTVSSADDYDNIKANLITYATDYREGKEGQGRYWTDEWYAKDGETIVTASTEGLTAEQKALNNGCGLTYDEYKIAYEKMLRSVYTNKGFYISRYEIGDEKSTEGNITRTSSTGYTNTPVSKADQIPYNYVTCSQAQTLSSSMKTGEKTSSLLFGIQWDLVCKFLEVNGNWDTATNAASYYIKSNSTSWGNYKDSSLTLKSGKYNTTPGSSSSKWKVYNENTTDYVTDLVTSNSKGTLLTTGASEGTKKMNIYDFAGNEFEWTLEKTTDTGSPCAFRGGYSYSTGSNYPASNRNYDSTTDSYNYIGFRVSLY